MPVLLFIERIYSIPRNPEIKHKIPTVVVYSIPNPEIPEIQRRERNIPLQSQTHFLDTNTYTNPEPRIVLPKRHHPISFSMFEEAKSKGNAVFSAGDYVVAVKHFTDVVPLSPTQPMFLLNVKFGGPNSGDDMEIPEETSSPQSSASKRKEDKKMKEKVVEPEQMKITEEATGRKPQAVKEKELGNAAKPQRSFISGTIFTGGGGERGETKLSKSLIEDEAELSDWVSDLRTNSIRGRVTSEDKSDSDMGRRYRSKSGRGREIDSDGNRGGGAGVLSTKRRRESNSNEFSEPTRRRTESTFGSPTRDRGTVGLPNARRGRGERNLGFKRDESISSGDAIPACKNKKMIV